MEFEDVSCVVENEEKGVLTIFTTNEECAIFKTEETMTRRDGYLYATDIHGEEQTFCVYEQTNDLSCFEQ